VRPVLPAALAQDTLAEGTALGIDIAGSAGRYATDPADTDTATGSRTTVGLVRAEIWIPAGDVALADASLRVLGATGVRAVVAAVLTGRSAADVVVRVAHVWAAACWRWGVVARLPGPIAALAQCQPVNETIHVRES
jgi:hypothetical protein